MVVDECPFVGMGDRRESGEGRETEEGVPFVTMGRLRRNKFLVPLSAPPLAANRSMDALDSRRGAEVPLVWWAPTPVEWVEADPSSLAGAGWEDEVRGGVAIQAVSKRWEGGSSPSGWSTGGTKELTDRFTSTCPFVRGCKAADGPLSTLGEELRRFPSLSFPGPRDRDRPILAEIVPLSPLPTSFSGSLAPVGGGRAMGSDLGVTGAVRRMGGATESAGMVGRGIDRVEAGESWMRGLGEVMG